MDPIEGLHYIFDRYAFLNQIMEDNKRGVRITIDSPTERIRKAIKLALALYHPDRLEHSAEDIKGGAKRKRDLLDDCKKFLLNDTVRPLYNERLRQFQQEKPDFVSADGMPINSLYAEMFDVDSLISDEAPDTATLENIIKGLLQFDEQKFGQIEALYRSMPDNPAVKDIYRSSLVEKYKYISYLEEAAWRPLGYENKKKKVSGWVTDAESYVSQVEEILQQTKTKDIPDTIAARGDAAQIGLAPLPLLLTFNDASGQAEKPASSDYALMKPEEQAEILEKMTEKARSNFEARAGYLRSIVQQKQDVLKELVTLTPVTLLTALDAADPIHHFYLVESANPDQIILHMILNSTTKVMTPDPAFNGETITNLRKQGLKANSHVVIAAAGLGGSEFLLELSSAAERTMQLLKPEDPIPTEIPPGIPQALPKPAP